MFKTLLYSVIGALGASVLLRPKSGLTSAESMALQSLQAQQMAGRQLTTTQAQQLQALQQKQQQAQQSKSGGGGSGLSMGSGSGAATGSTGSRPPASNPFADLFTAYDPALWVNAGEIPDFGTPFYGPDPTYDMGSAYGSNVEIWGTGQSWDELSQLGYSDAEIQGFVDAGAFDSSNPYTMGGATSDYSSGSPLDVILGGIDGNAGSYYTTPDPSSDYGYGSDYGYWDEYASGDGWGSYDDSSWGWV